MSDDQEYFYHRAEAELTRAQAAAHPDAAAAHSELAERYLARAYGAEQGDGERAVRAG